MERKKRNNTVQPIQSSLYIIDNLELHMELTVLWCNVCGRYFPINYGFNDHIKKLHNFFLNYIETRIKIRKTSKNACEMLCCSWDYCTIGEGIIRGMSKFRSLGRIRRTGWLTLPTWWGLSTNVSNQTQLPRAVWQEFPHCCHGNIHLKLAKLLDLHLCHGSIQWVSTRLALGMRDIFCDYYRITMLSVLQEFWIFVCFGTPELTIKIG